MGEVRDDDGQLKGKCNVNDDEETVKINFEFG